MYGNHYDAKWVEYVKQVNERYALSGWRCNPNLNHIKKHLVRLNIYQSYYFYYDIKTFRWIISCATKMIRSIGSLVKPQANSPQPCFSFHLSYLQNVSPWKLIKTWENTWISINDYLKMLVNAKRNLTIKQWRERLLIYLNWLNNLNKKWNDLENVR